MSKRTKAIIILSCTCFLLLSTLVIENVLIMRNQRHITENNNTVIEKTNDYITDRTVKIIESEKQPIEKQVIIQKEIINTDTAVINELKDNLQKTNEELKQINKKQNELLLFVMGGFSSPKEYLQLKPDVYVGIEYNRNVFTGRKCDVFIGGGLAVKLYSDYGFAGKLNIGIRF